MHGHTSSHGLKISVPYIYTKTRIILVAILIERRECILLKSVNRVTLSVKRGGSIAQLKTHTVIKGLIHSPFST